MSQHNIRVTMLVDGDEYLSLQSMSDEDGLSDSGFMRLLLKKEARRRAVEKVSAKQSQGGTAEPTQLVHTPRSQFHG